jgi:soluble lytic murein transglycosylase-like protein
MLFQEAAVIDPTTTQTVPTRLPIYEPEGVPLGGEEENAPPATPSASDPFSALDQQFSALINGLTQQLTALENQLMQALQALTGIGASAKNSSTKKASHGAKAGANHPAYHRYGKIISDAACRHEVDPELVKAVIRQESGFHASAISKAGAKGLMQLMPDTARSLGVTNVFDPQQNIEAGTTLLRQLLDRYHGQLDLALAAYNAGTGAVDKFQGVPPYPETQAYVRNVMESYRESALSA